MEDWGNVMQKTLVDTLRQKKFLSTTLVLFTLAIGILLGTLISGGVKAARQQTAAPDATPLTIPAAAPLSNEFADIAKRLAPAVVNINTESVVKPSAAGPKRRRAPGSEEEGGDPREDFFRRFFGQPFGGDEAPQGNQRARNLGSGVIVDPKGYILTNHHVVEKADRIRVKLMDDTTQYDAKLIGSDSETDLAVIKIDARKPLTYAKVGNSDAVRVGDWAIAIGSPLGFEETMTVGIISAKGREIPNLGGRRSQFQRFLQTDAAINRGNSGGPLLNIKGELIGINTAIISSGGGFEGLGFAMPSNVAVNVYNQLTKGGKVTRGSIGITFQDTNEAALRVYGAKSGGVIVGEIQPNGPAQKAGLKSEDVIYAINGKNIKNGEELVAIVADSPVGSTLKLSVLRQGKDMQVPVVVGDRTEVFKELLSENREEPEEKREGTEVMFGITVSNLTSDQRKQWEFTDANGVVVTAVEPGSFADDLGMVKNDIIVSINRKPVGTTQDVRQLQRELKPGSDVVFRVMRRDGGRTRQGAWRSLFLAGTLTPGQ
jgi:serine protease Do